MGKKKIPAWKKSIQEDNQQVRDYEDNKRQNIIAKEEARLAALEKVKGGVQNPVDVDCILEDSLWLGNAGCAFNLSWLQDHKITAVLNVSKQPSLFPEYFRYKEVPIEDADWEDIDAHFNSCIRFIDDEIKNDGRVLVHCKRGISRSATIVVAFMMFKNGFTLEEAFSFVQLRRSVVDPNEGFVRQLSDFNTARLKYS